MARGSTLCCNSLSPCCSSFARLIVEWAGRGRGGGDRDRRGGGGGSDIDRRRAGQRPDHSDYRIRLEVAGLVVHEELPVLILLLAGHPLVCSLAGPQGLLPQGWRCYLWRYRDPRCWYVLFFPLGCCGPIDLL